MSAKGEKNKSKAAKMKHEKTEPMSARIKEYGKKAAMKKGAVKKMGKKK